MLPILERELVNRKGWVKSGDLVDYYAISQVTPGVIAVNVSTFVGYKQKKVLGGIFATAGVVTPSVIIISIIAAFISNFEDIVWVQKALKGINVAVCALLTFAVVNFARKSVKKWWHWIFYGSAFVSVYFFRVSSVIIVLASAVLGICIFVVSGNRSKVGSEKSEESGENEGEGK